MPPPQQVKAPLAIPTEVARDILAKSLALKTKFSSIGHGCPVNNTVILTAGHISVGRGYNGDALVRLHALAYENGAGLSGIAGFEVEDEALDLSAYFTRQRIPFFEIAKERPKPGDSVFLVTYDFDARFPFLQEKIISGEFVRTKALHLIFETPREGGTTPGASGGCLFNREGKVVGVVIAYLHDGASGMAVALDGSEGLIHVE